MGSGASKKRSNTLPPVQALFPVDLRSETPNPSHSLRPARTTFDQGTDPFFEVPNFRTATRQSSLPPPPKQKDEESPSILLDDNAPIPRLPGDPRPESGTGIFVLDAVRLNGQWLYMPDEGEVEMEQAMSNCIEKAYVRGLPAANFKFEGNPCCVTFRDMSLTITVSGTPSVYPVVRRSATKEKLLWQADDQLMRPFIPDAEELVLSHRDAEVVFQMDNDVLNVIFEKGVVVDVNTGTQRPIQLVEDE